MATDSVRIDKWLWARAFSRLARSPTDAVDCGKVRLDGDRVKPARNVKVGDLLEIDNGATIWEVKVVDLSDVRGSATVERPCIPRLKEPGQTSGRSRTTTLFQGTDCCAQGASTKRDRRLIDNVVRLIIEPTEALVLVALCA